MLAAFRQSVENDKADARQRGAALYARLFAGAPPAALANPNWLLSLDDALFSTPLGALRTAAGTQGRFLAQDHSLQIIPSALWLLEPARKVERRTLLAVGDAIHNRGDRRFRALKRCAAGQRAAVVLGLPLAQSAAGRGTGARTASAGRQPSRSFGGDRALGPVEPSGAPAERRIGQRADGGIGTRRQAGRRAFRHARGASGPAGISTLF